MYTSFRRILTLYLVLLTYAVLTPVPVGHAAIDATDLGGIARIEVQLDPFSPGPNLVRDLGQIKKPTAFQSELRRRLVTGATGSAFSVAPHLLITTAHVVLGGARFSGIDMTSDEWGSLEAEVIACTKPWIRVGANSVRSERMPAQVIAVDIDRDLALIRCLSPNDTLVPLPLLSEGSIKVGMSVSVAGYTNEGFWVTRGKVQSLIRGKTVREAAHIEQGQGTSQQPIVVGARDGDLTRIQHSAKSQAGVSGGPLLDENGSVVGVAYGMLHREGEPENTGPSINLAVAAPVVQAFLKEHQSLVATLTPIPTTNPNLDNQQPTQSSVPTEQLASWLATRNELRELAGYIRRGNALKAIPQLTTLVRRNRYDLNARLLLTQAYYQEGHFAPKATPYASAALLNAAWLVYFVPEHASAVDALKILNDRDCQDKAGFPSPAPALRTVLISQQISAKVSDLLQTGNLPRNLASSQTEIQELLAQCEKAQASADRNDPIAAAALVRAYLLADEAADLRPPRKLIPTPDNVKSRAELLRKALHLSERIVNLVSGTPGPHALAGTTALRLWRLDMEPYNLQVAQRAYQAAMRLDPGSSVLSSAVSLLGNTPR